MKTIKLLSISNSFGVNLQTYAHQIAEANGLDLDMYVLYIGGCSLEQHCRNIKTNAKTYELFHNGESTHTFVSVLDGLKLQEKWDIILTQQVSGLSGKIASYFPYLDDLFNYVKQNSKFDLFGLQKTWEYGPKFPYGGFEAYNKDSDQMYKEICETYTHLPERFKFDLIINSGDIIHFAKQEFSENVYDEFDFHMSSFGCYLIGANLVKIVFNTKLDKIYVPNNENEELYKKAIKFVNQ